MKLSLIINGDTRSGLGADVTRIGDFGSGSLQGCRSWDFLTDGVITLRKFVGFSDMETILFVDEHEKLKPEDVGMIHDANPGLKLVVKNRNGKNTPRFNDFIYLDALQYAEGDYIAHFDFDVAAFQREGHDYIKNAINLLGRYKYVCQPTTLTKEQHGMSHASTRFFVCKRETLNFPELEKLLSDDRYREKRFPGRHMPCLEYYLSAVAGPDSVLYPPADNWEHYTVFSWVEYRKGLLAKLNAMPYEKVRDYVRRCGIHGANDLICQEVPE